MAENSNLFDNYESNLEEEFYCEWLGYNIEVSYDEDISREYIEKNLNYLNELDKEFLKKICICIRAYYENYRELYPDLSDDLDILEELENNPEAILNYIDIGVCTFDDYEEKDSAIPVLNISGDCEWAGDKGITIAAKDNKVLYVGPWQDFNIWKSRLEHFKFNYAL